MKGADTSVLQAGGHQSRSVGPDPPGPENHSRAWWPGFQFAEGEKEQHELWSAHKQALWSMLGLRTEGNEVLSTDVAVPLSRLDDILGVLVPRLFYLHLI